MQNYSFLLNFKVRELKNELGENYLSYYKSTVDNISEYYERKQERIAMIQSKRKLSDAKSESNTDITEAKIPK
jgi:hypothetical protein